MRKTVLVLGCIALFIGLPHTVTGLLSSEYFLRGTFDDQTSVFFIGKSSVDGVFDGFPMQEVVDSPLVEGMNGFPIIGTSRLPELHSVYILEDINISTLHSFEELLFNYGNHITQYSNVDVHTDNGLFLLGVTQGSLRCTAQLDYAFTSFITMNLTTGTSTRCFMTATTGSLPLLFSSNISVLTSLSNSSSIIITDRHGQLLWSGGSQDDYLLIQDTQFTLTQQSPLFLFPLGTETSDSLVNLQITPADSVEISSVQLIDHVSVSLNQFGVFDMLEIMQNLQLFDDVISTLSFISNGAMVVLQTDDTIRVDQSLQQFSSVGFARCNSLTVSTNESPLGVTVEGGCSLVFLGNHFYTPAATKSPDGIGFPFGLLVIWVFALFFFVVVYFFIRPPVSDKRDTAFKRYSFVTHIVLLLISIVLLDVEINAQFGISGFTALATQGFSLTAGLFLGVELVIWILAYFLLAIPIRILSQCALRLLRIGAGGKGLGKGLGVLSIWIFGAFYVPLFLNILLAGFNLNMLGLG